MPLGFAIPLLIILGLCLIPGKKNVEPTEFDDNGQAINWR